MTKEIELKSFVATSVKPRCFLTFVYDNNDINPESLSGKTMHVTNRIIVQRVDPRLIEEPEPDSNPKEDFIRKRYSFKALESPLAQYRTRKRSDDRSGNIPGLEDKTVSVSWKVSELMDLFWVALWNSSLATVLNWSGFNYLLEMPTSDVVHTVTYLPAINSSPTEMDTVLEILEQSKAKAEVLHLKETDAVVDQAIYAKAVKVLNNPAHSDLKSFINLRIRSFHTICIFLAVIGKRFGDAGLQDWIKEADLINNEA